MTANGLSGAARLMPAGAVGQIVLTLQANGAVQIETGLEPAIINLILDKVKAHLVSQAKIGGPTQQ